MSSFVSEASAVAHASPDRLWSLLADGDRWSEWNPNVRWSVLEGPLAPGTFLTLQLTRGRQTAHTIVEATPPGRLRYEITLGPLGKIEHAYELVPQGDGTLIKGRVQVSGALRVFLLKITGRRLMEALPTSLAGLAAAAEAPGQRKEDAAETASSQ